MEGMNNNNTKIKKKSHNVEIQKYEIDRSKKIEKYEIKKKYEFDRMRFKSEVILKMFSFLAGLGMIIIGTLSPFWMLIPTGVFVIGYSLGKDLKIKQLKEIIKE